MPATPRGSLPMYLPAAPFALADVVNCAALVDVAYDQYTQWYNQDYPSRSDFVWTRPNNGYAYSAPLFWTNEWFGISYDEPFGFVASDSSLNAYLVFRGTMSDADEYQDAKMDQTDYDIVADYGQVHFGFYEIYQGLQADIYSAISGLNRLTPFRRFFFTGHSLGSALSSLAIPDLLANSSVKPGPTIGVLHHNLASPRVGDPQYADMMDNNGVPTYRVVNTEDIVPDGPTAIFGSYLYKHIGTPVDFTAQYDTIGDNHSLDIAYDYAIANPNNPEGQLPTTRALGLARRPGVRVAVEGRLRRLTRHTARVAPPPT
jgi:triacylglycerol lipase